MALEYKKVGTETRYREELQTVEQDFGFEDIPICRPKFVFFEFTGLKPETPHWIFMDKTDVTKWVNTTFTLDSFNNADRNSVLRNPGDTYIDATNFPAEQGGPTNASGPVNSAADGTLSGVLYIQSNSTTSFPTGNKVITAIDVSVLDKGKALSYAPAEFIAHGIYDLYIEVQEPVTVPYEADVYDWVYVYDTISPAANNNNDDDGNSGNLIYSHYEPSTKTVTKYENGITFEDLHAQRRKSTSTDDDGKPVFDHKKDNGGSGSEQSKSSKILCDYIYQLGYLDKDVWLLDEKFGDIVATDDPVLLEGYHAWAEPMIEWMKKESLLSKIYLHAWAIPFTRCWAQHIAHKMEPEVHRDSWIGKIMYNIGVPISRFIGKNLTNSKVKV